MLSLLAQPISAFQPALWSWLSCLWWILNGYCFLMSFSPTSIVPFVKMQTAVVSYRQGTTACPLVINYYHVEYLIYDYDDSIFHFLTVCWNQESNIIKSIGVSVELPMFTNCEFCSINIWLNSHKLYLVYAYMLCSTAFFFIRCSNALPGTMSCFTYDNSNNKNFGDSITR